MGGSNGNYLSSVELFPRPLSETCYIPDLPEPRMRHSISLLSGGRLVICGGEEFTSPGSRLLDTCISWVAGDTSWTLLFTMRCLLEVHQNSLIFFSRSRLGHIAWTPTSLQNSIVLIGGDWPFGELVWDVEIWPGIAFKGKGKLLLLDCQVAEHLH